MFMMTKSCCRAYGESIAPFERSLSTSFKRCRTGLQDGTKNDTEYIRLKKIYFQKRFLIFEMVKSTRKYTKWTLNPIPHTANVKNQRKDPICNEKEEISPLKYVFFHDWIGEDKLLMCKDIQLYGEAMHEDLSCYLWTYFYHHSARKRLMNLLLQFLSSFSGDENSTPPKSMDDVTNPRSLESTPPKSMDHVTNPRSEIYGWRHKSTLSRANSSEIHGSEPISRVHEWSCRYRVLGRSFCPNWTIATQIHVDQSRGLVTPEFPQGF